MKSFILAEKPSVAKAFANALNVKWQKGFYGDNEYIITNCLGHLYDNYYPEDYDAKYKTWKNEDLPIIPEKFLYKPNKNTKKQAELVNYLLRKQSYEKIIIATDAGREGELIASIVLKMSGIKDKGNVYRFWCSEALTDETILKELKNLKPISQYEKTEKQGYYRSFADWLVGINITRLVTLGTRTLMHCGRVKTAVLYEIYNREQKRENFIPQTYYENIAFLNYKQTVIKAKMYTKENNKINTKFNKKSLDKNKFIGKIFTLESKDTQTKAVKPEKLFNITALQKKAFNDYGLPPDQTLEITQKLYEVYKCLSYPRTPSRVMGVGDVDLVKKIYQELAPLRKEYTLPHDTSLLNVKNKHIFNDELLEDHHALIPLKEIPKKASQMEKNVFELVVKNFFACFSKPYRYESAKVYLACDGYKFLATGTTVLDLGWKAIVKDEKKNDDENDFSQINFDALKCVDYNSVEKQTEPEPAYRFDSILAFMENPKSDTTKERLAGLGTPATRAGILKELIAGGYIKEVKKNLKVLERGKILIRQIQKNNELKPLIDVETTMYWEEALSKNPKSFYDDVKDFVTKACKHSRFESVKKIIGYCPICKKEIYEGAKNYYCSGYKEGCKFSIWKEIAFAKVSEEDLNLLLNGKSTKVKKCKNKTGKVFECKFKMNEDKKVEFIFD